MKICFIPWILESVSGLDKASEVIPMGILILTQILKEKGYDAKIFNINKKINQYGLAYNEKILYEKLAEEVILMSPDVIGISTIAEGFIYQIYLAQVIKRLRPDLPIALGGPQATVYCTEILEAFEFIDYIIRGESEKIIIDFVEMLDGKKNEEDVKSLSFRHGINIINNQNGQIIEELDEVPFVDLDLMEIENLDFVPIEIGRGCPFACCFCSSSVFFERKYRLKSVSRLIDEILFVINKYKKYRFDFVHDLFTYNKRFIIEFCNEIIIRKLKIEWSCSARADKLDYEMIDIMNQAGCVGLFCGIESGSVEIQKIMNKNLDIENALKNITYGISKGIQIMTSFVFGFPQETYKQIYKTLQLRNILLKLGVQSANPKVLRPIKGSPIFEDFKLAEYNETICLYRLDKVNSNQFVKQQIEKYPDIFSYYRVFVPQVLTINTLVALGVIISLENYLLSQTLLVEYKSFDFIEF